MTAIERVILVGFMCCGKSTVGPLLARSLDWTFVDFDDEIERARGQPIAEIFRRHGEATFRQMEEQLTRDNVGRKRAVLAPGGGWMARPELVSLLRPNSVLVWLRARPETIYRRHRAQGTERPLLAVDRPLAAIHSILKEREKYYKKADAAVNTDGREPAAVVAEILAALPRVGPLAGSGDR